MNIWKGVTSLGRHTRPDCNTRYDVRIKLVETWLFVCLTWRGNVGRLFVMVLHVVLTPMKSWTLIGQFRSRGLNTRFWLVVPPSSDYYYWLVYFKIKLATKIKWHFIFLISFLYNFIRLVRDLVNKWFLKKFLKLLTQNRLINRQNLALFHELKKRIGTWFWTPKLV